MFPIIFGRLSLKVPHRLNGINHVSIALLPGTGLLHGKNTCTYLLMPPCKQNTKIDINIYTFQIPEWTAAPKPIGVPRTRMKDGNAETTARRATMVMLVKGAARSHVWPKQRDHGYAKCTAQPTRNTSLCNIATWNHASYKACANCLQKSPLFAKAA